ncbi:competence protein ComEC [Mesorhizobium sp.]|uniref:ComEC/Rec2 family competence protein n=1 Tax=Mesorhizobium sp. TaxID=1871066 RepID=UPI000FE70904|nr:competence protein ComEC [Mesorhizobium sp.]RWK65361.1 MAG: competence protein ComEC [Mesorhizobium sp.]RWK73162.1 MAG: competence protein ComEC [Mesorhizobium sp.]RWK78252.1 MAG: competence protein ComEC [Mesorhizobium sp.]RWL01886.1 MAG: competence protein ComEC [Mesorhizobium sp.]RWL07508.1 MAG: competence protein ComEC [Mesorhizobium sp.]
MPYEVDFLPVGDSNGDAICVRYERPNGSYAIHIIDGGYTDTGDTIIAHVEKYYGSPHFIDHVVLSHADDDHATGLIPVMRHFDVGALWMNRPWLHAADIIGSFHGNYSVVGLAKEIRGSYPRLAELEDIANEKGVQIYDAFAGSHIGDFKILAPTRDRYLKLIPEFSRTPESYAEAQKGLGSIFADLVKKVSQYVESWTTENLLDNPPKCTASNESSLVQQAIIDGRRILLTADAGPEALNEAADVATYFGVFGTPNVVQIPHHGSRRNVTPTLLNRWLGLPIPEGLSRGLAFCSVGKNKAEYPRKKVSNAFTRRGYEVIPTRGFSRGSNWGMPIKPDWVSVSGEPFSYEYEE